MPSFVLGRILQAIPVLLGVVTVTFLLNVVVPGDPARLMMGARADEATLQSLRKELGLDRPLPVQYVRYLGNLLVGDLGKSTQFQRPVSQIIAQRLPATLLLGGIAIVLATLMGVALGVIAGVRQNSWLDHSSMLVALLGISLPSFFLAVLVQWFFGFVLFDVTGGFFPTAGYVHEHGAKALILPAVTLAFLPLATFARLTRSSFLEVKEQDYVRTARAKGLPESRVVAKHILKNALNPVLTAVSGSLAALLAGTFFIEFIFSWPGIGELAINAIAQRDFPLIQGTVLLTAVIFIVVNILTDIGYALIDPRVSLDH